MANTYSQVYLHIVFSTKNRARLIRPEIENDIWAGIGGCARKHKMVPLQIGGMEEHAHALVSTPTTISPSQAAKYLKGDRPCLMWSNIFKISGFITGNKALRKNMSPSLSSTGSIMMNAISSTNVNHH